MKAICWLLGHKYTRWVPRLYSAGEVVRGCWQCDYIEYKPGEDHESQR